MSGEGWLFGVVCGVATTLGLLPFGASYARYEHVDLCKAYGAEVRNVMPSAVREYLINKPLDSFFINALEAQPLVERVASEFVEETVNAAVKKEGTSFCYVQMYLNVALPERFDQLYIDPMVAILNDIRG